MHVGKQYPYHTDLWACTSQWYNRTNGRGWVPRKIWLEMGDNPDWPWYTLAPFAAASEEGVVAADRQSVTYPFGAVSLLGDVFVRIETGSSGPPTGSTRYTLYIHNGIAVAAAALSPLYPGPQLDVGNSYWPFGVVTPPNTVYIPPADTSVRPATWSEV